MNFQRLNRISKTYLGRAVLADFLFGPLVSFGRRNSRLPKPVRRSAPQRARLRCLASPARLTHSPAWSLAFARCLPHALRAARPHFRTYARITPAAAAFRPTLACAAPHALACIRACCCMHALHCGPMLHGVFGWDFAWIDFGSVFAWIDE